MQVDVNRERENKPRKSEGSQKTNSDLVKQKYKFFKPQAKFSEDVLGPDTTFDRLLRNSRKQLTNKNELGNENHHSGSCKSGLCSPSLCSAVSSSKKISKTSTPIFMSPAFCATTNGQRMGSNNSKMNIDIRNCLLTPILRNINEKRESYLRHVLCSGFDAHKVRFSISPHTCDRSSEKVHAPFVLESCRSGTQSFNENHFSPMKTRSKRIDEFTSNCDQVWTNNRTSSDQINSSSAFQSPDMFASADDMKATFTQYENVAGTENLFNKTSTPNLFFFCDSHHCSTAFSDLKIKHLLPHESGETNGIKLYNSAVCQSRDVHTHESEIRHSVDINPPFTQIGHVLASNSSSQMSDSLVEKKSHLLSGLISDNITTRKHQNGKKYIDLSTEQNIRRNEIQEICLDVGREERANISVITSISVDNFSQRPSDFQKNSNHLISKLDECPNETQTYFNLSESLEENPYSGKCGSSQSRCNNSTVLSESSDCDKRFPLHVEKPSYVFTKATQNEVCLNDVWNSHRVDSCEEQITTAAVDMHLGNVAQRKNMRNKSMGFLLRNNLRRMTRMSKTHVMSSPVNAKVALQFDVEKDTVHKIPSVFPEESVRSSRTLSCEIDAKTSLCGAINRKTLCRRLSHIVVPESQFSARKISGCEVEFNVRNKLSSVSIIVDETSPEVGEHSVKSARNLVLHRCNQSEPLAFEEAFPLRFFDNCRKIGEGLYGEVFRCQYDCVSEMVLKIIPIEGQILVNGEKQKKYHEVLSELVIAMELSNLRHDTQCNTGCFVEVMRCLCVQGKYPKRLTDLWFEYDEKNESENDPPTIFDDNQLFIVLELADGGQSLESYCFASAAQSFSAFVQLAFTLATAESALQFEHRDLHWGNVLINKTSAKNITFKLKGKEQLVPSKGIQVTVIDFTLSRMTFDGCYMFNDLAVDPDIFMSQGDYQFEVYRLMQNAVKNVWSHFQPYTNVLWLHYILDKMLSKLHYKNVSTRIHKKYKNKLSVCYSDILKYNSAYEFVTNGNILQMM